MSTTETPQEAAPSVAALPPPVTDYGFVRLELMGHRYREGRLSEVVVAGQPFLRLDLEGGAVEIYASSAVYCISPATAPVPVAAIPARFDYALDGDLDDDETCGCGDPDCDGHDDEKDPF